MSGCITVGCMQSSLMISVPSSLTKSIIYASLFTIHFQNNSSKVLGLFQEFSLSLHSIDLAKIWHGVLHYGPNYEMGIKKFQLFLLAKKTRKCTWSAHICPQIWQIEGDLLSSTRVLS